jgi:tetratricopeptide (TPR) repeat protein
MHGSREREFSMPRLVRQCARERVSGTLTLSRDGDPRSAKTFVWSEGTVVFTTSTSADDRLGERMIGWGMLDRDGLHRALDRVRGTGEVLGQALVALGVAPAERVRAGVERLILERASEPFSWRSADAFFEERPGAGSGVPAAISPEALQFAGIRSVEDAAQVRRWLGDMDDVLVPDPDPFRLLANAKLLPQEAYLVSRLDRPMSAREIVSLSGMEELFALRLVCALRFCDVLRSKDSAGAATWYGDRARFTDLVVKRVTLTSDEVEGTVDAAEAARVCYLVEEKLRSLDSADYYALLEVERRAPADRIKSGYRELAKTFHPDRHAQLAAFDANIKSRLSTIFDALTKAYTTLANAGEREAYDRKLAEREQQYARRAPEITPPQSAAPRPRPARRPAEPERSAAPKAEQGAPRPSTLRATPPRAATPPAPPRSPAPPPAGPRPAAQRPEPPPANRAAAPTAPQPAPPADRSPAEAPPAPPVRLTADQWYERGVAFAEAGNHAQAMRALRRGTEVAPDDGRMFAALGRSLNALGGAYRKEAEKVLKRAAELAPDLVDVHMELGRLYKATGRPDQAREEFLRVVTFFPDEPGAREEYESLAKPTSAERKLRLPFFSRNKKK